MKRTMRVFLGDDNLSVGQLHHAALGAREHASFEYDRPSAPVRRSMFDHHGFEGAVLFRSERYGIKFRPADTGAEYQLITGRDPRTVCYRALLRVVVSSASDSSPPEAGLSTG